MGRLGLGFMAHRFDVVSVGPDDERTIVGGMVLRAQARRPIVFAARLESGAVELFDLLAAACREREVEMRWPFGGLT